MKKMKAVLAVLITAGLLAGCAGRGGTSTFEPKSSGIFVTDAGPFSTATVETYDDQDYYNEEEWKTFLEENVASYNAEHGEGAVALQSCSLKDGTASMIFDYATGSDLAQFTALYEDTANSVNSIDIIPVAQALEEAGTAGTIFIKTADGKTASTDEIAKKTDYHVVAVDGGPVKIQTEGKIMYTSDGVKLNSSFIAEISEGKNYIIFK